MIRLSDIQYSSSGNPKSIAQNVLPEQSFVNLCEKLTVRAYIELFKAKKYKPEWEEDTFSANFKDTIENICFAENVPIAVFFQDPQLTTDILSGTTTPKSAKRMDLVFSIFPNPNRLKYGIEAKILTSKNTAKRNAKSLCTEYVVSGMDRFISGDYKMGGCMVGYIVSGNENDTLNLINEIICEKKCDKEILQQQHTVVTHTYCYQSFHTKCTLKHFLFSFV
jgi:hypothetical protein